MGAAAGLETQALEQFLPSGRPCAGASPAASEVRMSRGAARVTDSPSQKQIFLVQQSRCADEAESELPYSGTQRKCSPVCLLLPGDLPSVTNDYSSFHKQHEHAREGIAAGTRWRGMPRQGGVEAGPVWLKRGFPPPLVHGEKVNLLVHRGGRPKRWKARAETG